MGFSANNHSQELPWLWLQCRSAPALYLPNALLVLKTLDLQNMHQLLSTSEPIRLHKNTNSSDCCLYKFNCDSTPFTSRVTFILKGMIYLCYLTFPERHALSSISHFTLLFSLSLRAQKSQTISYEPNFLFVYAYTLCQGHKMRFRRFYCYKMHTPQSLFFLFC